MIDLMDFQLWAGFITLTVLELVLGIDNLVFIAILAGQLPPHKQKKARKLGLAFALITRLALLAFIKELTNLTAPLFVILGNEITIRDLVFIIGGFFLIYKGTTEIHARMEGEEQQEMGRAKTGLAMVVFQMMMFDIIFSLDSIITAIGMANKLGVMMAAVVVSVAIMLAASDVIADFINKHPTVKMLALSFLLLIGMTLIADGLDMHIPKGYIYAAMSFSAAVEMLNQQVLKRKKSRGDRS